ncbi:LysR family transcriptional regulator ArgP [Rhodococcus sp. G-MC3]|uniref:LysR family transcriptional regulator ArgP n=1 Tax=Rhodococcus sp. G-MC3 TaxID=3046209 RepID=UPI0024BA1348|nr:LysR family transcriptional regulator ArgP [Rhodococcus sp. G-MC3]MDJ0392983.1 LysR family transcriptional regulator ArgP [Rhodococcus sp. G-MC3]
MHSIDLPQLEALAAVIDEGSFDAAATRLHVTPSAISQRVKSFETAVGAVLLQRSKPARVTEAGVPYLRLAQQIRSLVAEMATYAGSGDVVTVPIAVNGDSLNTWVLPALAQLSGSMDFDIRREDQDHSAELLRQGIVMAAVTASADAVQGCSVTRLGIMRYRPMCSPQFRDEWLAEGPSEGALSRAPMLVFDRSDDLQDRYLAQWGGASRGGRRHYVPSSADFAEAVRLGLGWAVLPRQQSVRWEADGQVIDIAPNTWVDVTLYWQQWKVRTAALEKLSDVIVTAARANLD